MAAVVVEHLIHREGQLVFELCTVCDGNHLAIEVVVVDLNVAVLDGHGSDSPINGFAFLGL